ncbi:MAG: hypothetical protein LBD22_01270 [Spirochaetaceae bacterium]|jgi:tetratricopeptide (TPR) repeat protein|nr:hypothetical protein [Spirochaetaceae bacterium]
MKKIALFIIAGVLFPLTAQQQVRVPMPPTERPFWFILEEGKKAFREHEFGDALALFEEARAERKARYTRMETVFINLLSIGEVRRFGDALDLIEKYIAERNQFDAAAALDELVYRVGRPALRNSAKTALSLFNKLKEYSEGEYWIGEVYRLEGEYAIALQQYSKALEIHVEAEKPLWNIDLLYKIAETHRIMRNWVQMEASLNKILAADTMWSAPESFARTAMTRTLNDSGINPFLAMFRYNNGATEKAHRLLGEFCYKSGRHNLAETHLAFAVLIQNSVLIEAARSKRYNFEYTTLDELLHEIDRRTELKNYMAESDYFRTLYYLSAALYANGKTTSAQGIWSFLAARADAGEWSRRAANQLRKPFVETTTF